jgi:hypothetical protein
MDTDHNDGGRCQSGASTAARNTSTVDVDIEKFYQLSSTTAAMFSPSRWLIVLALGLVSLVQAKSSTGNSVLVVVEPKRQDDFSIFFEGLKGACILSQTAA